jgi:hypothetical protein
VEVDLSRTGLRAGDAYEIRDAQNYLASPLVTGVYGNAPVVIPMSGLTPQPPLGNAPIVPEHTGPEFGAFVVLPRAVSSVPAPEPQPGQNPQPEDILLPRSR